MKYLFIQIVLVFASIFNRIYGYEGLNLLFKFCPSVIIIAILKKYGAEIGSNTRIKGSLLIHNADRMKPIYGNLKIGNEVYVGRNCFFDVADKIVLGNRVSVSHNCTFNTHTDVGYSKLVNTLLPITTGPITIGDDSYLGLNVVILENCDIGKNSIIAACTLVQKSFPDFSIIAGNPSKIIGSTSKNNPD